MRTPTLTPTMTLALTLALTLAITITITITMGLGCQSKVSDTDVFQEKPSVNVSTVTAVASNENSARALYAVAMRVYRVEVIDLSTREVRATLDEKTVERIKSSIVLNGLDTSLTVTSPPWDVVLHLHIPGRAPFIAHPVGLDRLRLRSDVPENSAVPSIDEGFDLVAGEVTIDFEVSDVLHQLLGEPSKEYLMEDSDRRDMIRYLETE
jgi:hypothetical protein